MHNSDKLATLLNALNDADFECLHAADTSTEWDYQDQHSVQSGAFLGLLLAKLGLTEHDVFFCAPGDDNTYFVAGKTEEEALERVKDKLKLFVTQGEDEEPFQQAYQAAGLAW